MTEDDPLDTVLRSMGEARATLQTSDFMDGVWVRIGEICEAKNRQRRAALFAGMLLVSLGSGFGVTNNPANASSAEEALDGAKLSPAALLKVAP
tara:strand:+ start:2456 stop:2737 length:282 start_codon:yes stop_codon:yes gene_type:complete